MGGRDQPRRHGGAHGALHATLGVEVEGRQRPGEAPVPGPEVLAASEAHGLWSQKRHSMAGSLEPLGRAPRRVVEHAHHPDDRSRQDGLAAGLIVEGNVAADHG